MQLQEIQWMANIKENEQNYRHKNVYNKSITFTDTGKIQLISINSDSIYLFGEKERDRNIFYNIPEKWELIDQLVFPFAGGRKKLYELFFIDNNKKRFVLTITAGKYDSYSIEGFTGDWADSWYCARDCYYEEKKNRLTLV